jgi:hypothetical protein
MIGRENLPGNFFRRADFLEASVSERRLLVGQLSSRTTPGFSVVFGRSGSPTVGWHAIGTIALPRMKVVCAWCLLEGKPGDLGEREPLEDPGVSHSICAGHVNQLLEDLPSRSFPDVAMLIVVRPNDTALFERLQGLLTGVPGVKVIVDRRTDDRRSAQDPVREDRRRVSTRRLRQGRTVDGYTVVRFTPQVPPRF